MAGQTLDEIASERGMARSTIEGHLAHFVERGDLDLAGIVETERAATIEAYILANPEKLVSEVRLGLEEQFSYGEIKLVLAAMKSRAMA